MLFWKRSWLRKVESGDEAKVVDKPGVRSLDSKLKTMSAPDRYFCQSTELAKSTKPRTVSRKRVLLKAFRDVQSGAVGVAEMIVLIWFRSAARWDIEYSANVPWWAP